MFSALAWIITTAKAFSEIAATLGVSLIVLVAAIALAVLYAPTRRLAVALAVAVAIAIGAYGRGAHDEGLAVRQLWAAADAAAALEKAEQQRDAETARDDSVGTGLRQLAEQNQILANKVADYEKRDRERGGVCLVGDRADGLRDVAGAGATGGTAAGNQNPVLRKAWRPRRPTADKPRNVTWGTWRRKAWRRCARPMTRRQRATGAKRACGQSSRRGSVKWTGNCTNE
jgi:hypothetical protein